MRVHTITAFAYAYATPTRQWKHIDKQKTCVDKGSNQSKIVNN